MGYDTQIVKSFVLELCCFTLWALLLWDFSNQAVVKWMIPKAIFKQIYKWDIGLIRLY